MLELRTLGVADLRTRNGVELTAVEQQPKRFALLAYLAIAAPARFVRRDTLLGLFWPELDAEHARAPRREPEAVPPGADGRGQLGEVRAEQFHHLA